VTKLAAAVALGRRSRAVLTAERRTEIARLGGLARGRQIRARRAAVVEAAKSKTA